MMLEVLIHVLARAALNTLWVWLEWCLKSLSRGETVNSQSKQFGK